MKKLLFLTLILLLPAVTSAIAYCWCSQDVSSEVVDCQPDSLCPGGYYCCEFDSDNVN